MLARPLSTLLLLALAAAQPPHPLARSRRRLYEQSLRGCRHGSDGVLITLLPNATVHDAENKTHAERFAERLSKRAWGRRLQSDATSIRAVYSAIVEGVAAVLDESTLEEVLHDPEVKRIEANCLIVLDDPRKSHVLTHDLFL